MAFDLNMAADGQTLVMQMGGVLDDECQFPTHESLAGYTGFLFDFEKVTGIDAIGIRRWLSFVGPLAELPMTFKNVPPAIVFQFNTMKGFLPAHAVVESVFLPLYCEACQKEASALLPVGGTPGPDTAIPKLDLDPAREQICAQEDKAACKMRPEYTELKYFSFLRPR